MSGSAINNAIESIQRDSRPLSYWQRHEPNGNFISRESAIDCIRFAEALPAGNQQSEPLVPIPSTIARIIRTHTLTAEDKIHAITGVLVVEGYL